MTVSYSLILMLPQQERSGFLSLCGGKTLRPRRRLALGHRPGAEVGLEPRSVASKFTPCPTALPPKDQQGPQGEDSRLEKVHEHLDLRDSRVGWVSVHDCDHGCVFTCVCESMGVHSWSKSGWLGFIYVCMYVCVCVCIYASGRGA